MKPLKSSSFTIIYILFFLSGAAGLAYEILWIRILGLSFGHTTYAVTTVLASFMGGLALGSYLIGRFADRHSQPLLLYGCLELAIGLYCLAAPALLNLARKGYLLLYPHLMDFPLIRVLMQFTLASAVMVIPAALMGGTLPVITRAVVGNREETGRHVAILYGTNTLGAAFGAFAAGYLLLPTVGIRMTNYLGVTTNLFVGLAALALFRRPVETAERKESLLVATEKYRPLERVLLWGFALSGAVAMSYQIVWVRTLVLVIGSSTYAFSAILVTFLIGIALGSYIFARIRGGETPSSFAGLQLAIGLSAFILIPIFHLLPRFFLHLFQRYEYAYSFIQFIQFLIVALVVLLPTTLMGMVFPCIAGILTRNLERVGSDVGRFYAYNTMGAIAGSLITGFFLLSVIGIQKTLAICIGINILLAATVLSMLRSARRVYFLTGSAVLIGILILFPQWSRSLMVSGAAVYPDLYFTAGDQKKPKPRHEEWDLLFYKEGISSTVAVTRSKDGNRTLRVNGYAEAGSTERDMESFTKLAYLPMILHPEPVKIAIVGLGGGITALTATKFDTPEQIDIIEIDPNIVEAHFVFTENGMNAFNDKRTRLFIDDGLSFMKGVKEFYDVIIIAPSQTWITGVANLFTTDFIKVAKERLNPGGILCQWIQGYNLEKKDLQLVMRSFQRVFPNASLWETFEADYILLGTNGKIKEIDLNTLSNRMNRNNRLVQFLAEQGEKTFESILTSYRLNSVELASFIGSGPVNTHDQNFLEFNAPKTLYLPLSRHLIHEIQSYRFSSSPPHIRDSQLDSDESHLLLGSYLLQQGKAHQALWEFRRISTSPASPMGTGMRMNLTEKLLSGKAILEDFEGEGTIPIFPFVNGYRPEKLGKYEEAFWDAYLEYFLHHSGIEKGSGRSGSNGLVMNGINRQMSWGFVFPLTVEPDKDYLIKFWMKNIADNSEELNAGYLEFDLNKPFREWTFESSNSHLVRGEKPISIKGNQPWTRHTFTIHTSPRTRLVHIYLVYFKGSEQGITVIDDFTVQKIPSVK